MANEEAKESDLLSLSNVLEASGVGTAVMKLHIEERHHALKCHVFQIDSKLWKHVVWKHPFQTLTLEVFVFEERASNYFVLRQDS